MTARQRRRHRRSQGGSVGKKLVLGFVVVLVMIGIGVASAGIWVLDVAADAPEIDTLKPAEAGSNTQIFAADGTSLGYVQSDILRTPVALDKIPNRLQKATIAIEDEHFYEHGGVDYGAVVRAALENVEAGEVKQGGSTITQQLVRNLYIKDPEDTIQRKIIEAKMAMEYEDEYTKNQILNQYLNTASYGTNDGKTAVGVEAASQVYFDKSVSDLNVGEAALLAGLPQAPTDYNPFINPKGAKQRRNEVLGALRDQGYISRATYSKVANAGLGLHRGFHYEQRSQQYFFDFVQNELIDKYGVATAREGGLKVYTTLDPHLQSVAEQAIAAHPVTGAAEALVSTDVDTGEIKAMASSSSYDVSQFNLAATGRRQPGSSFKPYLLTTAVSQGVDPDSTYYPAPGTITLYPYGSLGEAWTVSGGAGGSISLRDATANSVNTVYAQLVTDIGWDDMDEMAKKMGVSSPLQDVPADVLGASDVTVLDQSNGFATIANGGVHHDPTAIAKVVFPDGKVDEPPKEPGQPGRLRRGRVHGRRRDEGNPRLRHRRLATTSSARLPARPAPPRSRPTPGSSATRRTSRPRSGSATRTRATPMPGYGADLAAPIWHDYMEVAAAQPCDDFPQPQNPASLSSYYSDHTASSGSDSSGDSYDDATGTYTTPSTTTPDTGTGTGGGNNGYDPDLYAPGAGQDAAPTPGGGGAAGGVDPN